MVCRHVPFHSLKQKYSDLHLTNKFHSCLSHNETWPHELCCVMWEMHSVVGRQQPETNISVIIQSTPGVVPILSPHFIFFIYPVGFLLTFTYVISSFSMFIRFFALGIFQSFQCHVSGRFNNQRSPHTHEWM